MLDRPTLIGTGRQAVHSIWLFAALSACVAATALSIIVVYVVLPTERHEQVTEAWTEHTHQAIDAIDGILASAADAETGQRGFLLTRDESFLAPYDDGIGSIPQRFAMVERLTADNRDQQSRLEVLRGMTNARLAMLAQTIRLARGGDFRAAADMVREGSGKALMDGMRATVADMGAEEQRLLRARRVDYATARTQSNRMILFLVISGSCAVLLGGAATTAAFLAANAARQSEATAAERLRLLNMIDFVPVMILDHNGVVRFWSGGCRELYGWTSEQAVGQSARGLLHTVASVSFDEMDAELRRTGGWRGELCHRAQNGETVIVLAQKVLRRDARGGYLGHNLTVVDVTALRRTETALQVSEMQFHAIVDAAADAIIIVHVDGRIDKVNPAALRMFGYNQIDELVGRDLGELVPDTEAARHHGDTADHRPGSLSRLIGTPERELFAIRRDGTKFPIELSVGSFGFGGHQYLTSIIHDTSDRSQVDVARVSHGV